MMTIITVSEYLRAILTGRFDVRARQDQNAIWSSNQREDFTEAVWRQLRRVPSRGRVMGVDQARYQLQRIYRQ